eukprot:2987257-Rhodomonas_salina.1
MALRMSYALSGTDLRHAPTRKQEAFMKEKEREVAMALRACYAVSGTELAYAATRKLRGQGSISQRFASNARSVPCKLGPASRHACQCPASAASCHGMSLNHSNGMSVNVFSDRAHAYRGQCTRART